MARGDRVPQMVESQFFLLRIQRTSQLCFSNVEQLGHKLLLTSLELEKLKSEANEETRKNKELIHLLKFAMIERDEAKNQLRKLLSNKTKFLSTITVKELPTIPHHQDNSHLVKSGNDDSCVTESNSTLSGTHICHSQGSSSVNSLLDVGPFVQEPNALISGNLGGVKFDPCSLVIDNLLRGKSLPQQGKFLQAVLEAGPLLHTLFMSGPLPHWQNPPQLQPFEIPTAPIKGSDAKIFEQSPLENIGQSASRSLNLQPHTQTSCGSSQVLSAPIFNFTDVASEVNASNVVPLPKRRRFF